MKVNLKRLLSYYKPYLGLFTLDMVCAMLVAAIALIIPLGVRYITGELLLGELEGALPRIYQAGLALALLVLLRAGLYYVVDYYGHSMGAMMERDLRRDLFAHLEKLSFSFYDEQKTGQLMSRLTSDTQDLSEFYHHVPEDRLIYALEFIGSLVILFTIHVPLTLSIIGFLPLILGFTLYFNRRMNRILSQNKQHIADINAQVEDSLSGIRVAQSFANEDIEQAKFNHENERFLSSRRGWYRSEAFCYGGSDALCKMVTIVIVVFGGAMIARAQLGLSDLIAFLMYAAYLTQPLEKLMWMTEQFQMGITSFQRISELMDIAPEIVDKPDAIELSRARGDIAFEGAGFRYKEQQPHVLKNINIEVPAGDYVALVGSSGVGKSTLCSLIPRFYDVTQGRVLLDSIDVRDIKLSSLRRNIGVVQQDVYLFSGSIIDNIRYGKPGATTEEVTLAAKKANAHAFIMGLPDGYDTDIGQRGIKLSGGQRQRLSIARVFLKDPPILIFDEATSALDNESERLVQMALQSLSRDRTTFVIAHRLSTIKSARRILVLTEQGIEEMGTHDQLIQSGGAYAQLYGAQFEI